MTLAAADLSTLSRLLDDALDLDPAQREAWLLALPAAHSHLQRPLRDMLARHATPKSRSPGAQEGRLGFMVDGPRFDAPTADPSQPSAGQAVGPYRLIRELGRGGMGTVWLAERVDGQLSRQLALKLPRLVWGDGLAQRMARERDISALLEHPHIARLYDAGVDALGRPYLALEYIAGQPIDVWCRTQALTVRQRLELFLQVVRALAYAHGRLVVHRDLKPSNVLVTADGQAHLLDFGIAKLLQPEQPGDGQLTQEQGRMLTPHYASPEQLVGEAVTVASDVYSLGVLLYELLTGRLPHAPQRQSLAALEEAVLHGEPPLASVRAAEPSAHRVAGRGLESARSADAARALRGDLDAILAKALRRAPAQRYATADALAADLERHLAGAVVLAQPDRLGYRLSKALARHRISFAATAAVLVALLGGAAVSIVQARRAQQAAGRAQVVKAFVVDVFRINGQGDTTNNSLRQLPAELLLVRGATLIEQQFPAQPDLQAELYGLVAGIFADMGASDLAARYARREIATLEKIGASPPVRARATLLLAQSLQAQGQLGEAQLQAAQAITLAQTDAALRPQARVLQATVLRALGRRDEAQALLALAERDLQGQTAPSAVAARILALRARLFEANQFEQALPLYLAAITQALAAEGPQSPAAVEIRMQLATNLVLQGRVDQALPHREAALLALRSSGPVGEIQAALKESDISKTMYMMGVLSFADASKAIERSRSAVTARGALVPEAIKAAIDFDLGSTLVLWGDVARAAPLIAASGDILRAHLESPRERLLLAAYQGLDAMYRGDHAAADRYFRERFDLRTITGDTGHPYAAFDRAYIALNLGMQARFDEAMAVLLAAPEAPPSATGARLVPDAPPAYQTTIGRAMARIALQRGDAAAAWALLPKHDNGFRQFPFDSNLLSAEIACALGRPDGLPAIERGLLAQRGYIDEHHPELARVRAVAGLCALAAGKPRRAAELAAQARAAIAAQPQLSNYFLQPVERLHAALLQRTARH